MTFTNYGDEPTPTPTTPEPSPAPTPLWVTALGLGVAVYFAGAFLGLWGDNPLEEG